MFLQSSKAFAVDEKEIVDHVQWTNEKGSASIGDGGWIFPLFIME